MPQPKYNSFTSYELTLDEERLGHALSPLTICVLQNVLSDLAHSKLNSVFDPSKPLEYAQAEAAHTGKIELLTWLIEQAKWANSGKAIDETSQDRAQE